jgi:splicing factor, proline- and glutamine-rich
MVSNELLYRAFSVFGAVDRAVVLVEGERAQSRGEGLVEFLSKKVAHEALVACQEGHFVLTRSMVPVVAEPYEVML